MLMFFAMLGLFVVCLVVGYVVMWLIDKGDYGD